MKKLVFVLLVAMMIANTGCVSYLNHGRVKKDMIAQRVLAAGNAEQIKAVKQGVDPEVAVRMVPLANNGAGIGVDLFDLQGVGAWLTTFKEAPISSTLSLAADGAAAYYTAKALSDSFSGNENEKKDSNINLTKNDETTVILIDVKGDNNTVSPEVNAESQNPITNN